MDFTLPNGVIGCLDASTKRRWRPWGSPDGAALLQLHSRRGLVPRRDLCDRLETFGCGPFGCLGPFGAFV